MSTAVTVSVVPGLCHPAAYWPEGQHLALRASTPEEMPAVLEAAAGYIRRGGAQPPALGAQPPARHDAARMYSVAPEVRKVVLLRDGDVCRFCGTLTIPNDVRSAKGRRFARVEPDGPITPGNLVTACVVCSTNRARLFVAGLSAEEFAATWSPRQIELPLTFRPATARWLADHGGALPTASRVHVEPVPAAATSDAPAERGDASGGTCATRRATPAEEPVWQPITCELLATLRPGDVVELRTPVGPDGPAEPTLTIRATLTPALLLSGTPMPNSLAIGDPSWGPQLSNDGQPLSWMKMLELSVVHRVQRLYENSTRTEPVVGDVVRDRDRDVWHLVGDDSWLSAALGGPGEGQQLGYLREFGQLTLLWDGATDSLPAATS